MFSISFIKDHYRMIVSRKKKISFKNKEINKDNLSNCIANRVLQVLKNESITVFNYVVSKNCFTIACNSKKAYDIITKFTNSRFTIIKSTINKSKYHTHYIFEVFFTDLDQLMSFINKETLFPLTKRTGLLPSLQNDQIIFQIPTELEVDLNKKLKSSKLSLRFINREFKSIMKTAEGGMVYVSNPIMTETEKNPIISNVFVNNQVIWLHLSPFTSEKISELSKKNYKTELGFELDGVIYGIFYLEKRKAVQSDVAFMKITDKKQAKEIIQKLEEGPLYQLEQTQIIDTDTSLSTYVILILLLILFLLSLAFFLTKTKRKAFILAYLISLIGFGFFIFHRYHNYLFVPIILNTVLMWAYLNNLIFIVLNYYHNKRSLYNISIVFSYFVLSLLIMMSANCFNISSLYFYCIPSLYSSSMIVITYLFYSFFYRKAKINQE